MKLNNIILPVVIVLALVIGIGTYFLNDCNVSTNKVVAPVNEEKIVITNIDNVGSFADAHKWKELEGLFADEVVLDYESFTGQPAETLTPNEIITRWEGFLPGFDITQHKNSNHKVYKTEDGFKATTDVRATHYIDGVHGGTSWTVDGSYDFALNNDYKITKMKLNFDKTIGNNDLPVIALSRVDFNKVSEMQKEDLAEVNDNTAWPKPANPAPIELKDNKNVKVVQDFFAAYGANDLEGIKKVMTSDVEWFIPGHHKLAGTKKGIDEVVGFFGLLQKAKFMAEPMIFAANDNYVIDVHRGYSNTGENDIDMNWVLVYMIENGKIKKVQNFSADSYSADKFFDSVYTYEDVEKVRKDFKVNNPNMKKVTFDSKGSKLVGNLYFPENYDESKKYPAVVVVGSWTTVKEQMAGLYADKLSKDGFITLAFDARGYGESEGTPRYFESATLKIEDIDSAVAYLKSRSDVENIGAFGICAGSSYVLMASVENDDIKAVGTTASWIHDSEAVKLFYGGEEGVQEKIAAAKAAKKKFAETGEMDYIKLISTTDPTAAMYGNFDYYLNPERGAVPEWNADKFAVASWEDWLTLDPTPTAAKLDKPTIMIHSDGAVLPEYTKTYFENIKTDDKKLVWLDTNLASPMHQFEFYDAEKEVNTAVQNIAEWFDAKLK